MKIITTPMCEDILKIANIEDYTVVKVDNIKDADIAIVLSETKCEIPRIAVKLNTYQQIKDAVIEVKEYFNTEYNENMMNVINKYISDNNDKKDKRKNTKIKVYSNFLTDTINDMGYTITDTDYDYIVAPDFLKDEVNLTDNVIIVPSHSNVSKNIIDRVTKRYELLETKLCMKQ